MFSCTGFACRTQSGVVCHWAGFVAESILPRGKGTYGGNSTPINLPVPPAPSSGYQSGPVPDSMLVWSCFAISNKVAPPRRCWLCDRVASRCKSRRAECAFQRSLAVTVVHHTGRSHWGCGYTNAQGAPTASTVDVGLGSDQVPKLSQVWHRSANRRNLRTLGLLQPN